MGKIGFKCLECGHCCRNLFRKIEGALVGLSLFPDEKKLFPEKLVSPNSGIGWGLSGPKHIIDYQLNTKICPHISNRNLCKVYDKQPVNCQAFPMTWMGPAGTTIAHSDDCTFVKEFERDVGSLNNMLPMTPKNFRGHKEWHAIREIGRRITKSFMDHPIDGKVLWIYDLKTKEWQIIRA